MSLYTWKLYFKKESYYYKIVRRANIGLKIVDAVGRYNRNEVKHTMMAMNPHVQILTLIHYLSE